MNRKPFWPADNATKSIAVGASTANVKLTDDPNDIQIRVMNNNGATIWIRFGGSGVVAAVTDIPVGAGGTEVFTTRAPQGGSLYVAAIAAGAGTASVYFTPGTGI